MIVAVALLRASASVAADPPPQQSPILGHRASSQTVCRLRPRRSFLILAYEPPAGMEVLRNEGSRGLMDFYMVRRHYLKFEKQTLLYSPGQLGQNCQVRHQLRSRLK